MRREREVASRLQQQHHHQPITVPATGADVTTAGAASHLPPHSSFSLFLLFPFFPFYLLFAYLFQFFSLLFPHILFLVCSLSTFNFRNMRSAAEWWWAGSQAASSLISVLHLVVAPLFSCPSSVHFTFSFSTFITLWYHLSFSGFIAVLLFCSSLSFHPFSSILSVHLLTCRLWNAHQSPLVFVSGRLLRFAPELSALPYLPANTRKQPPTGITLTHHHHHHPHHHPHFHSGLYGCATPSVIIFCSFASSTDCVYLSVTIDSDGGNQHISIASLPSAHDILHNSILSIVSQSCHRQSVRHSLNNGNQNTRISVDTTAGN